MREEIQQREIEREKRRGHEIGTRRECNDLLEERGEREKSAKKERERECKETGKERTESGEMHRKEESGLVRESRDDVVVLLSLHPFYFTNVFPIEFMTRGGERFAGQRQTMRIRAVAARERDASSKVHSGPYRIAPAAGGPRLPLFSLPPGECIHTCNLRTRPR